MTEKRLARCSFFFQLHYELGKERVLTDSLGKGEAKVIVIVRSTVICQSEANVFPSVHRTQSQLLLLITKYIIIVNSK
jgi:hypothetical protein